MDMGKGFEKEHTNIQDVEIFIFSLLTADVNSSAVMAEIAN